MNAAMLEAVKRELTVLFTLGAMVRCFDFDLDEETMCLFGNDSVLFCEMMCISRKPFFTMIFL